MQLHNSKVLIIDDEPANVRLLERILNRNGYQNIITTTDPRQAVPLFLEHEPDLVILDLMMPYISGFDVMKHLNALTPAGSYHPILVLTADANPETKHKALAGGAKDFLTKPFDQAEVLLRVANLLQVRHLHSLLKNQNQNLEEKVQLRTRELEDARVEVLDRLALAAEYRDDDTGQHTYRVGDLSRALAQKMQLSEKQCRLIRSAAPLHDVGKIGIPDLILLKPGKLTPDEFSVVKTHTTIGAKILSNGRSELMHMAETITLTHHERWDGSGYPCGLRAEEIPLEGRIVAIADVFDALTHDRPYKSAWPASQAIEEIKKQAGTQFDPDIVEAFLDLQQKSLLA